MKKATKNAIKILESRIEHCKGRAKDNTLDTILAFYKGKIQAYEDAIGVIKLKVKYEPKN